MLEHILIHWKSISKILLITFIALFIHGYFATKLMKEHIVQNWTKYRNKIYILPFAGFIKKEEGQTTLTATLNNFINFAWQIVNQFLLLLVKPLYPIFRLVVKVLDAIKSILDNFRKQFKIMRNFLFSLVSKVYERLQNGVATMTMFFLKLREGMKRQLGLFRMLSWTVAHSYYFMHSLIQGPVGDIGRFADTFGLGISGFTLGVPGIFLWLGTVCFDPETLIECANSESVKISNLKLGDILKDGSVVKSKMTFNIENSLVPMFNYKGVIVSGDHVVFENNNEIRVKLSKNSIPVYYDKKEVVCLVTNSGKIVINNIEFADYLDTHDVKTNIDIHRIVESSLNNVPKINIDRCRDLVWGFSDKSIINGKKISDYKIGDKIEGNTIRAKIIIDKNMVSPFRYISPTGDQFIISGNQLVYENYRWIRLSQSIYAERLIHDPSSYYVNFATDNNKLKFEGMIFRDFMEDNSESTNSIIDNYSTK